MSRDARDDDDAGGACWTSTSESVKCRVEPDEKTGQMRNRCERVRQTLRHCAGKPDQVVESVREETDSPVHRPGAADLTAGDVLSPLLGRDTVDRLFSTVDGFSDVLRVAERMERAMRDAFPELGPRTDTPEGAEPRRRLPSLRDVFPKGLLDDSSGDKTRPPGGAPASFRRGGIDV